MANASTEQVSLARSAVHVEVEQRLHYGWTWLRRPWPSEHDAFKDANRLKRQKDVRAVVVVVVEAGSTSRYTLKSRFPRPPKQPAAEWLAEMGMSP